MIQPSYILIGDRCYGVMGGEGMHKATQRPGEARQAAEKENRVKPEITHEKE